MSDLTLRDFLARSPELRHAAVEWRNYGAPVGDETPIIDASEDIRGVFPEQTQTQRLMDKLLNFVPRTLCEGTSRTNRYFDCQMAIVVFTNGQIAVVAAPPRIPNPAASYLPKQNPDITIASIKVAIISYGIPAAELIFGDLCTDAETASAKFTRYILQGDHNATQQHGVNQEQFH